MERGGRFRLTHHMALRTYQGALATARTTTGVDRVDLQQIPSLIAVFIYINGGDATVQVEVADQTGAALIPVATVTASTVVVLGVPISTLATSVTSVGAGVSVTSSYRAVVGTEAFSQSLTMFSNGAQIPPSGFVGGSGQPNEVAVWGTTTSLTGYTDFTWDDLRKLLLVGDSVLPADALESYTIGQANDLTGSISGNYAFGRENVVSDSTEESSLAFGWFNTISAGESQAFGDLNTISGGDSCFVFGQSNTINLPASFYFDCFAFGEQNSITAGGNDNYCFGLNNQITESSFLAFCFGDQNLIQAVNSTGIYYTFGVGNTIGDGTSKLVGDNCLVGELNSTTSFGSMQFGQHTITSGNSATAVGYNLDIDGPFSWAFGNAAQFSAHANVSGSESGLLVAGTAVINGPSVAGDRSILISCGASAAQQTLADSDTIKLDANTIVFKSFGLAAPSTLQDGMWWVQATGTTPTRVAAIKLRDGGVTRTIASITY